MLGIQTNTRSMKMFYPDSWGAELFMPQHVVRWIDIPESARLTKEDIWLMRNLRNRHDHQTKTSNMVKRLYKRSKHKQYGTM